MHTVFALFLFSPSFTFVVGLRYIHDFQRRHCLLLTVPPPPPPQIIVDLPRTVTICWDSRLAKGCIDVTSLLHTRLDDATAHMLYTSYAQSRRRECDGWELAFGLVFGLSICDGCLAVMSLSVPVYVKGGRERVCLDSSVLHGCI